MLPSSPAFREVAREETVGEAEEEHVVVVPRRRAHEAAGQTRRGEAMG